MVVSILNPQIHYTEPDRNQGYIVDKEDIGKDVCVYEIELLGQEVFISLGTERNSLIGGENTSEIIYFPVYLIVEDGVHSQIGVYEIYSGDYVDLLDSEEDLELSQLPLPLLYKDVTSDYLISAYDDSASEDEKVGESVEGFVDDVAEDSLERMETEVFAADQARTWIETFLKSNKYTIQDNQGGGDCLFHVIVDALKGTQLGGKPITVKSLRELLAATADEELFLNYQKLYGDYLKAVQDSKHDLEELAKENQTILSTVRSRQEDLSQKADLLLRGRKLREEFTQLKLDKAVSEQMLEELRFMKNVKSLADLKHTIQSCDFWGDTWAISTLERAINVKIILFSQANFEAGDINNVLLCGQLNDDKLERKGIFRPKYYIMTSFTGDHYKLIKYDDKTRFSFRELPQAVKALIVEKCMETIGGAYQLIPKFVKLKDRMQQSTPAVAAEDILVLPGEEDKSLYNPDIVFQFYDKSAVAKPGRGSGESIDVKEIGRFGLLATPKNMWRRKLSANWVAPFKLDGQEWASVTHYAEAAKFKEEHPDTYLTFTMGSKSKWSKDPLLAIKAGSKTGGELRDAAIEPDKSFTSQKAAAALSSAQKAKFEQAEGMKEILLGTKDARLMQYKKGRKREEAIDLMKLRKELAQTV